jgi:hypothetical protein
MTLTPARFQRDGSSKFIGCLVYAIVAPFVALCLALFLSVPIMLALEANGMSRDRASAPFLILLPLFVVGVAVWAYRDYQRRAALEVVIDREQVTVGIDSRRSALRFDDVVSIRLVPTRIDFACALISRSGRVLRIPAEIAPFTLIRDALDATLIPELVRKMDDRIASGEAVALRISGARLLFAISRAAGALLLGLLMLVNPWTILMGILVVRHATMVIRQSWMGIRGGLVVEREGLLRFADTGTTPVSWGRLTRISSDPIGLVLRSTDGQFFTLSALTDDFLPAVRWINARLR